jgi:hypothetical protein
MARENKKGQHFLLALSHFKCDSSIARQLTRPRERQAFKFAAPARFAIMASCTQASGTMNSGVTKKPSEEGAEGPAEAVFHSLRST